MKQVFLFLAASLLTATPAALAGDDPTPKKPAATEDSILHHYLDKGAWQAPLFSRERERFIDSALALLPHNAYLWQQRAMPLFKQGKYELGMPFLDSAVAHDATRYTDYRAFIRCIFQKSYRAALADFDAAERLNGNIGIMDHPYDFYRALCYLQLNQFSSAERLLRKCIDATTAAHGADWVHQLHWFYLGVLRHEQEDYTGAAAYLDKCLKAYPRFSDAAYYRACCHLQAGEPEKALTLLKKAQADARERYSFAEDNAFYEPYPYAVKPYVFDTRIALLEARLKNTGLKP